MFRFLYARNSKDAEFLSGDTSYLKYSTIFPLLFSPPRSLVSAFVDSQVVTLATSLKHKLPNNSYTSQNRFSFVRNRRVQQRTFNIQPIIISNIQRYSIVLMYKVT